MDTIVARPKNFSKFIVSTLNVSIIMGLFFSQNIFQISPIFANEPLKLANNAVISPLLQGTNFEKNITEKLSLEQRKQNFDKEIRQKYKTGVIFDVDTGVKHIKLKKYYQGRPVNINVVEVNSELNPNLHLTPALASESGFKKATIQTMAKKNNSIVAINGTFFKPATGVPLGTLMIDKKMYTGPIYNRVAMGIFDNGYDMARIQLNANIKTAFDQVKVDNINQPRMLSTYVIVYTSEWGGFAPPSPKYGKQIAISNNKVVQVSTSTPLAIPQDGFVVVGPAQQLDKLSVGESIKLDVLTVPGWDNVNHIISGGPYLVKKGQVFVDIAEQKLTPIGGRNPRTAVGYTANNNLVIVTVDGREEASVGMTLTELANFMKSIGCYDAMNLDGGGSTVLYVNGKIANCPSIKGGIALSNALTLNKLN